MYKVIELTVDILELSILIGFTAVINKYEAVTAASQWTLVYNVSVLLLKKLNMKQ